MKKRMLNSNLQTDHQEHHHLKKNGKGRPCFSRSFVPDVKQGDVIIFPFFMVHEVSKQECDGPRITFSGNLYKEI